MRRNIRNLILVAVCIVFLAVALLALKLTGNDKGASSSDSSSTSSISLVSKKSTDVVSMKVTNEKGSYTLLPVEKGSIGGKPSASSSSSSSGLPSVTYTVKELAGFPVNTSETGNVVQNGFSLVASKNLGTVSDLEEFGLKNPQATVEVSFKDGSSFNYKIGKVSPTDTGAYYMCGANSSTIYLVTIDQGLLESSTYFINKELLAIKNAQGQNNFTSIKLSGKNYPQPVVLSTVNKSLMITAPGSYEADIDSLNALETALASLTADSVEAVNPDAAALKKYGLDKPTAIAEYTVNNASYRLLAGAEKNGSYSVMLGGCNAIFSVPGDSVKAWTDVGLFGLRHKTVLIPNMSDVNSMTVTVGSTVNKLTASRTKDEKKSTQDTPSYTYKLTGTNGKQLDYTNNYTNFFNTVTEIAILDPADKVPSGKPVVTIAYGYYAKPDQETAAFYKNGDRRYTAVVNGKPFGIVTQDDIDKITQGIQLLESGQAVS